MTANREALAHLGQHPAWGMLRELAHERREARFRSLARRMMHGEHISRLEIEYERGFFKGMDYLLDNPSLEAKRLHQELEKEGDPEA